MGGVEQHGEREWRRTEANIFIPTKSPVLYGGQTLSTTTVVGDPVLLSQPRVHFSGRTPNAEESSETFYS